jgi:hypothetical protein
MSRKTSRNLPTPADQIKSLQARVLELEAELAKKDDQIDDLTNQLVGEVKIPPGYWIAPLEPDEGMWTAGRDPVMLRDMNFKAPHLQDKAWRVHPISGELELDTSKGTTAVHVYRAMRMEFLKHHETYSNPRNA